MTTAEIFNLIVAANPATRPAKKKSQPKPTLVTVAAVSVTASENNFLKRIKDAAQVGLHPDLTPDAIRPSLAYIDAVCDEGLVCQVTPDLPGEIGPAVWDAARRIVTAWGFEEKGITPEIVVRGVVNYERNTAEASGVVLPEFEPETA